MMVPPDFSQHLREARAREDGPLVDYLTLMVILAGLIRAGPLLRSPDLVFLGTMAATAAAMVLWRGRDPVSFARWREIPAIAMRIAVASSPTAWTITQQALNGAVPYRSGGEGATLANAALFALVMCFSSFAACGSLMALARPVRLWLHIPTQAAVMLLISRMNRDICSTAALKHPAAEEAAGGAYACLTLALQLLGGPTLGMASLHGSPVGRCSAILGLAELLLGFVAPTIALAVSESRLFGQYQRQWGERWHAEAEQQQQQQQQGQSQHRCPAKELQVPGQQKIRPHVCHEQLNGTVHEAAPLPAALPAPAQAPAGLDSDTASAAAPHFNVYAAGGQLLKPPGPVAARFYCALLHWLPAEPEARLLVYFHVALLTIFAGWQLVILVTPA